MFPIETRSYLGSDSCRHSTVRATLLRTTGQFRTNQSLISSVVRLWLAFHQISSFARYVRCACVTHASAAALNRRQFLVQLERHYYYT